MARTAPAFAGAVGGAPRVSLLPRSEVDRRERAVLTRKWFWVVFAAIVVAAVAIGAAFAWSLLSTQRLSAAQAQTNSLLTQIGSMSDVSSSLAAEQELQSFRADAMGGDFAWKPLLTSVEGTLPKDVKVTGFDLATGAPPKAGSEPASEVGLTGTLTLTSPNVVDIAGLSRKLATVPGVQHADARATKTASGTDGFDYTVDVTWDQSIYSGAYAKEAK
ncbi:hypothetical protein [Microbacterium terrisoli]|uniref:hypothetical protein n=1 Tax=Microbacterium terrisoli TaxID=3242192 RepID=UPI00280624CB|nr:hypothetical protein [Microbacterium protaetiae]